MKPALAAAAVLASCALLSGCAVQFRRGKAPEVRRLRPADLTVLHAAAQARDASLASR